MEMLVGNLTLLIYLMIETYPRRCDGLHHLVTVIAKAYELFFMQYTLHFL